MQTAIISDIHGNKTAIAAVLQDIENRGVDQIICLGDVATIGPSPQGVIDQIAPRNIPVVRGNHDIAILEPNRAEEMLIPMVLRPCLSWSHHSISDDAKAFVQTFTPSLFVQVGYSKTAYCFHALPDTETGYLACNAHYDELESIIEVAPDVELYIHGHTHIQYMRNYNGKVFLNPGSIGHAFASRPLPGGEPSLLPKAQYAIVKTTASSLSVELCQLSYDRQAYRAEVSASSTPLKEWLINQIDSTM